MKTALALLIAIGLIATLAYDLAPRSSEILSPGRKLGKVTYASKTAYRRAPSEVYWVPVRADDLVYQANELKTGSGSGLHWRTLDGLEARLNEQSLLQVERGRLGYVYRLTTGRLALQGTVPVKVEAGAFRVTSSGATFVVDVTDAGKWSVVVTNGSVTVQTADRTYTESSEVAKNAVELASPKDSDVNTGNGEVDLKWVPPHPAILTWQVARDAQFGEIVVSGQSHDGHALVKLEEGAYYWRVSGQEGETSFAHRFFVVNPKPPKLSFPLADATVRFWNEPQPIAFEWESETRAHIELSTTKDFAQPAFVLEGRNRAVFSPLKAAQKWYWRVVMDFGDGKKTFSETRQLNIERLSELPAPELYAPDVRYFSWSAVPEATEYQVFVWRSDQQRPVTPTATTKKNGAEIPASLFSAGGAYHWTVAASNEKGAGTLARKHPFDSANNTLIAPRGLSADFE